MTWANFMSAHASGVDGTGAGSGGPTMRRNTNVTESLKEAEVPIVAGARQAIARQAIARVAVRLGLRIGRGLRAVRRERPATPAPHPANLVANVADLAEDQQPECGDEQHENTIGCWNTWSA